jgi:hypothetical protein
VSDGHPDGRLVGWWCPSMPDGPLIPPGRNVDPCGQDVPVYAEEDRR